MKRFLLTGLLLLVASAAHTIPSNPSGTDFGSVTCTGNYRLGPNFTYNCTTGELIISSITAAQIIVDVISSTDGYTMQDLHISTQAIRVVLDNILISTVSLQVQIDSLELDKMERAGRLNLGIATNLVIQSLSCSIATKGACVVVSSDEGDPYYSLSSTPGDFRNGRTGKIP